MSTTAGLVLVEVSDPPSSTLLFPTSTTFWGLSVGPDCETLLGSNGPQYFLIDLPIATDMSLCSEFYGAFDLTSLAEFDPPACNSELDLDDSSGVPDTDFNSSEFNCLTIGGG